MNDVEPIAPGEKWAILFENTTGCGLVNHHSNARAIGCHGSHESALEHAKALALNHPDTSYFVVKLEDTVRAGGGLDAVARVTPGWKTIGDLYRAADCIVPKALIRA